ncbi:hypothetical protein GGR25_000239 [Kaistia hirudinis]|uniref:Uncharacterized protein n=1 Tax=Kaistia hirudinis TaxID=1293440 RepID=A0A840AGF9_9HYPH|nr:hypothetical protein [Kaistia hirudinis]MBB3929220.1 hypothetical protein [Kaistia hirudinis]
MAKTEQNLKASEEFIRNVLAKNFRQTLRAEELRAAAIKLCDALPATDASDNAKVAA